MGPIISIQYYPINIQQINKYLLPGFGLDVSLGSGDFIFSGGTCMLFGFGGFHPSPPAGFLGGGRAGAALIDRNNCN